MRKSSFIPPQRGAAGRCDNIVVKKENLPVTYGHVLTPLFEVFYADLTSIKTVILSMMVLNSTPLHTFKM